MSTAIAAPNYRILESEGGVLDGVVGEHWVGDQNIRYGPNAFLRGAIVDGVRPRFIHTGWKSSAIGCANEMNNGVRISNIDLECRTIQGQQNQVLGFQGTGLAVPKPPFDAVSDAKVELDDVGLYGRTFSLYAWGGFRNSIEARNCKIKAGQYGVTGGGGSGSDAQFITLWDTDVTIDFTNRRGAGGDQGLNSVGLWAQGGQLRMYGGSITVVGNADSPKAYGAWLGVPWKKNPDDYKTWPVMELYDVQCRVNPSGSADWCDVIGDIGAPILIFGGKGSGPNGKWVTRGNVVVK